MKQKLSREFKIGAFGIAMILLLYFSINFIKSNRVFTSDKTFYAVFESADGLEASAPVITKGFRIGTVEKVAFDLTTQNIIVTISVLKEYPLPIGSKVKITSSSLLGGKVIEVQFGTDHAHTYPNKDTLPTIFEPSLMQMAGAEYSSIKDRLKIYADKIDNALTGLETALSEENMANLSKTLANLNSISGNIDAVIAARRENLNNIVVNLDKISGELRDMAPQVNHAIANISAASDSLPNTLANISTSVNHLTSILKKIESGDGSLGKLVNDQTLYTNLTTSLESLNAVILDLKENPKKYLNVVVFPRKEKTKK